MGLFAWGENLAAAVNERARRLAGSSAAECVAPADHLARRLGGGGCNMFQEPIDLVRLTHSILIVVAVTVAFEQVLHQLRHFLSQNALHEYVEVVGKVTGELMVLGFISFGVLMTIQFGMKDPFIAEYLLMFELAHVWIFTVGVLYAVASTIWLLLGTFFKARWTRWSAMDNGDLRRQVKRVLRENENDIFMRVRRSCICATVVGPDGEEEALQYHLLQAYFLTMYIGDIRAIMGRRRARKFDFSEYLTGLMNHTFLEQLEVDIVSWIGLIVVIYALLLVRYLLQLGGAEAGSTSSLLRAITVASFITNVILVAMIVIARWFSSVLRGSAYKAFACEKDTPLHVAVKMARAHLSDNDSFGGVLSAKAHESSGAHTFAAGGASHGGAAHAKPVMAMSAGTDSFVEQVSHIFSQFDDDNSGTIDSSELGEMMVLLGVEDDDVTMLMNYVESDRSVLHFMLLYSFACYLFVCSFISLSTALMTPRRVGQ